MEISEFRKEAYKNEVWNKVRGNKELTPWCKSEQNAWYKKHKKWWETKRHFYKNNDPLKHVAPWAGSALGTWGKPGSLSVKTGERLERESSGSSNNGVAFSYTSTNVSGKNIVFAKPLSAGSSSHKPVYETADGIKVYINIDARVKRSKGDEKLHLRCVVISYWGKTFWERRRVVKVAKMFRDALRSQFPQESIRLRRAWRPLGFEGGIHKESVDGLAPGVKKPVTLKVSKMTKEQKKRFMNPLFR